MKEIILIISILVLAGCSKHQYTAKPATAIMDHGSYLIDSSYHSKSQDERIKFLIFHYTAVDDSEALRLLSDGSVSAHYLIPSNPVNIQSKLVALQLVPEHKRAWHAGISSWDGRNNINDTSIGIEIVNDGFHEEANERKWLPYNKEQILLATRLASDIISRYKIKSMNILAHSDIAPLRKTDPGPKFPWQEMAKKGIGAWPDRTTVKKYLEGKHRWSKGNIELIQKTLDTYGYNIPQTGILDQETMNVISAFQMHFRPSNFTGVADKETEAIARALVEKYRISS